MKDSYIKSAYSIQLPKRDILYLIQYSFICCIFPSEED